MLHYIADAFSIAVSVITLIQLRRFAATTAKQALETVKKAL